MTIRLLGAFAHPDDDVLTLGATLVAHRGELVTTLVFATSGEAGPIADPAVSRDELGPVREREQRAAMEALGVADWVQARFLRLPDYYLPDVPFEQLVARLSHIIDEVQPDVVVTFGPDGVTSHHDHIRVGEAAAAAFDRASGERAPTHLFQAALPRSAVERFSAELVDAGNGPEGSLLNLTGVPDDRIAVRFDARPHRAAKLEAIHAHRTQIGEWERIPEQHRWILLDEEAFVQARPAVDTVETRSDLFDGVDASPGRQR
jgi:LmbE family N-acetylglucosaminyl deacetylase